MEWDRISEWVSHRIGWFCVAWWGLPRVAVVGQELTFEVPGRPIALGCNESFPGDSRSVYADHF